MDLHRSAGVVADDPIFIATEDLVAMAQFPIAMPFTTGGLIHAIGERMTRAAGLALP